MPGRGIVATGLWIALAASGVRAAPAPEAPVAPGFEGEWEGFISETPARLSRIVIRLERAGELWRGAIDLPGAPGLELSAIRIAGDELHFELQNGDDVVPFDGTRVADQVSGKVVEGGSAYPFDLQKLPAYPPPADRTEAWAQDLDVVRRRFLRYDRSFDPHARRAFGKAIDRLESRLPRLDDPQVIVALSEAVALSGNAHTRLYLLRNRTELRRLPLRVWWFADGPFVVKATSEHADLLGCRVTRIAGHDPRSARRRVARLFAGNDGWVDYKSTYFLTSPEILHGTGMADDMDHVRFAFACDGRAITRSLDSLPLRRSKDPTEAWRDLSPLARAGDDADASWVGVLSPDEPPPPLYLRHPDTHYWFEYLAEDRLLFLQYNRSQNTDDGPEFSEFAQDVERFLAGHPVERFVVDLRFNTGGNNSIAAPFFERLAALGREGAIGRLYVIIGRATFSAGISHAAYLKQETDATFVGEPVGDRLDIWSEGGNIELPNSGLTVHFTNGFHSLSNVPHPELAPYLWSDLDLTDLDPDVPVQLTSREYFAGRDPAMEAILRP